MKRIATRVFLGMMFLCGALAMGSLAWAQWHEEHDPLPLIDTRVGAEIVFAQTANPTELFQETVPTSSPTSPAQPKPTTRIRSYSTPAPADARVLPAATPTDAPTPILQPSPQPSPQPTARPTPQPTPTPEPAADAPTRIVAPSIGLDINVVRMGWKTVTVEGKRTSEWVVPKNAAGWHVNSALPGQPGNTVISGHNNVEGEVFRYLPDLQMGAKITLYAGDKAYDYYVEEKYILKEADMPLSVRQKNAEWIGHFDDVRLTLVTCWPYQWPGNTHRMIIVARPHK